MMRNTSEINVNFVLDQEDESIYLQMALYDPSDEDELQPIGGFMEAPGSPEELPVISECKLALIKSNCTYKTLKIINHT